MKRDLCFHGAVDDKLLLVKGSEIRRKAEQEAGAKHVWRQPFLLQRNLNCEAHTPNSNPAKGCSLRSRLTAFCVAVTHPGRHQPPVM